MKNKTILKSIGALLLGAGVLVQTAQAEFIHPGITHKRSDLDRVKYMVEAQLDPWYSSYQEMTSDSKSSYNYTVRGDSSFTELGRDDNTNYSAWNSDIRAAYYNAIRWYVTGDTRHAEKSIEIFNAWTNLTSVTSGGTDSLSGGVGYIMIEAAEIIKSTYSGWSASEIQDFSDMLVYPGYSTTKAPSGNTTFYWMAYQGDPIRHGNQGLSGWRTVMAMGIFMDNEIMYDRALRYVKGLPHRSDDLAYPAGPNTSTSIKSVGEFADDYNVSRGYSIEDYGYNELMTHYIWANGQCQESSRDQQHTAFGIGLLTSMAEMAWNQGEDLYGIEDDRLLLGLEYNMKYNVSSLKSYPDQEEAWEPTVASGEFEEGFERTGRWYSKAISTTGRGGFPDKRPVFEMPVAHYLGRGLKTAEEVKWIVRARDVAIDESGYEVAGWSNDAIGWGGLTARRPDYCYGDPIRNFSAGLPDYAMHLIPATIEAENYDHFSITGEGHTYHDLTSTNSGGQYRLNEGVDITTCSEGGYALTSLEEGEWITYTISVPSTTTYDISIRYAASAVGGKIKFSFGGVDQTGEVDVPFGASVSTGLTDWQDQTLATGVLLSKGVQSLKIQISGASKVFELDSIRIERDGNILSGHWKFDEGSGTVALDSSGNKQDGTITSPTWVSGVDGGALAFDGTSAQVIIPAAAFDSISSEVSIAMWVYGDSTQPLADSLFRADDASGDRVVNIHLPYNNSTVYWDAGNDSSGYDRINKTASESEFKGSWAHWVFSKSATSGFLKIYRNGTLWHSGSGKTKTMAGVTSAAIGSFIGGGYYTGSIDDVRLYNIALSDQEILDLYRTSGINSDDVVIGGIEIGEDASGGQQVELFVTNSVSAYNYQVMDTEDLVAPAWQTSSDIWPGNGGVLQIDVPMDSGQTNLFYRVEAWRQ